MNEKDDLLHQASEAAKQAIHFDSDGKVNPAIYMYRQAAYLLTRLIENESQDSILDAKVVQYLSRAKDLEKNHIDGSQTSMEIKENGKIEVNRANFLILEALGLDETGEIDEAIEAYSNAVELCIKVSNQPVSHTIRENLRSLADQALSRAEALKKTKESVRDRVSTPLNQTTVSPVLVIPPLGIGNLNISKSSPSVAATSSSLINPKTGLQLSGKGSYTKDELDVLKRTSVINRREYVPFMSIDLKEKFAFSLPFCDKDGLLTLSPKQKKQFHRWARPEDISSEPRMIEVIDCFSVKQTCVSDCSFVASVSISALYEKRFRKRLITDIIFPKNKQGNPVYNPCGKYMIKLHINGIPRKIIIDDQLPVERYGGLLCSYSTNKNEFWISLIEKAYMKVMGGYDFPGSNSNIDLYALTGWIPERVSLKDKDFAKDITFRKILERFHKGDVLVTIATGDMGDATADRAGLVSTHAYAMLDIREVKGKRMMMLKNPWSHLRWKGNFSELDATNWTPEMCKLLNYDPKSAQMFDNGVFWIDLDSLCNFFDVIYMNWNPSLFTHTFCMHQTWRSGMGPVRDLYNIGENPQYNLEVSAQSGGCAIWILLTRHITDIADFKDNNEYITLLVYKTGGKKIFYPFDPPPFLDGVRINSPHYLCKMVVKESGQQRYTLVVSQYEKQNTINYSLRVYCTAPFRLSKIVNMCKYKHEETGKWSGRTAGGCPNNRDSYKNNPIYQFKIDHTMSSLRVELKAPKEVQIGFEISCIDSSYTEALTYFNKKRSGDYRAGFCVVEFENVVAGTYNIMPSTFYASVEVGYFLNLFSSQPLKLSRLQ